jgi:anti-anti-sigma regulatory factor
LTVGESCGYDVPPKNPGEKILDGAQDNETQIRWHGRRVPRRAVLGEESGDLRNAVKSLLAEGKKKVILDLGWVAFIDSAGLGTLVAVFHTAKAQGGKLVLCASLDRNSKGCCK